MSTQRFPGRTGTKAILAWRLLQLFALVTLAVAAWRYLWLTPYRIDMDVYRMGARAWLDGSPLYSDGALFTTQSGLGLPFTYPPLAAIVFAPFAWLSLPAASTAITLITFVLLIVTTVIVLVRLEVWKHSDVLAGPAWQRQAWLAVAIVAPASLLMEPVRANFDFGQVNVALMTLVVADCVPRKTLGPRGMLLGVAMALKLTPAVFLLYFLLRRDTRALVTAVLTAIGATLIGFLLARHESWVYWTTTILDTDRIGGAAYRTNQNIAGTLARLSLGETPRFLIWAFVSLGLLALTVWAADRLLKQRQSVLALVCVAMFGLVVSPVSWSHHWVWALPAIITTATVGYRYRNKPLIVITGVGLVLMLSAPFNLMPAGDGREAAAPIWRQLLGCSYIWWAIALIVVGGCAQLGVLRRTKPHDAMASAAT